MMMMMMLITISIGKASLNLFFFFWGFLKSKSADLKIHNLFMSFAGQFRGGCEMVQGEFRRPKPSNWVLAI